MKKVRFSPEGSKVVGLTTRWQDMTPEERKVTWFSRRELCLITKRNWQVAALSRMTYNENEGDRGRNSLIMGAKEEQRVAIHGETCRGLEKWLQPEQRAVARHSRRWTRQGVLDEQQRQRQSFGTVINPMQLCLISQERSAMARSQAILQGMLDQVEASRISLLSCSNAFNSLAEKYGQELRPRNQFRSLVDTSICASMRTNQTIVGSKLHFLNSEESPQLAIKPSVTRGSAHMLPALPFSA